MNDIGGPLAPAVLEQIERELARVARPASPQQIAERLMQLTVSLRGSPRPPRDMFLLIAAMALAGADSCRERDGSGGGADRP